MPVTCSPEGRLAIRVRRKEYSDVITLQNLECCNIVITYDNLKICTLFFFFKQDKIHVDTALLARQGCHQPAPFAGATTTTITSQVLCCIHYDGVSCSRWRKLPGKKYVARFPRSQLDLRHVCILARWKEATRRGDKPSQGFQTRSAWLWATTAPPGYIGITYIGTSIRNLTLDGTKINSSMMLLYSSKVSGKALPVFRLYALKMGSAFLWTWVMPFPKRHYNKGWTSCWGWFWFHQEYI